MVITIKEEGTRFGCRVGAIIFNHDKTKILLENQQNKIFMFPGGRIDVHEDSQTAIERELKEELNLKTTLELKYILEMFLKSTHTKYHEIGFYYISQMGESEIKDKTKSLDSDSIFTWIPIKELDNYNILSTPIKDKIVNNEIEFDGNYEHFIYREY